MHLPKKWSEVTVEQFMEISEIDKSQGAYYYNTEILSIICDEPPETIEDMDIDEMFNLVSQCKWALSQPSKNYKHELLGMKVKPLNKLCLYEYIDLDYYFTNDYIKNLANICGILYRQTKINEWGEEIIEPYEYDCTIRADRFLDLPITDVYGIINEFLKFRENFLNTYKNLFQGEEPPELTPEAKAQLTPEELKEEEEEKKDSKWSWERMIYGLCNNDLTKSDKIGGLSLTYVFNMMGMKKELEI
jgi:hypothetical protein